jgi:hypothetical protein
VRGRWGKAERLDPVQPRASIIRSESSFSFILADVFKAPLHTADLRLARAVREHTEVQVADV